MMKLCITCHKEKPESDFQAYGKGKTFNQCKECKQQIVKSRKPPGFGPYPPQTLPPRKFRYHVEVSE